MTRLHHPHHPINDAADQFEPDVAPIEPDEEPASARIPDDAHLDRANRACGVTA